MNLPVLTTHDAARRRLELCWVDWRGNWEEFVKYYLIAGTESERRVLEDCPVEFRASAVERVARIDAWIENRLPVLLENVHDIATGAVKFNRAGDQIPDNTSRLAASKFLIERALGQVPERESGTGDLARGIAEQVKRKNEIANMLKGRGVRLTERSVEIDGEPQS